MVGRKIIAAIILIIMLSIKNGVALQGIKPEIMIALVIANEIYKENNVDLFLTSCSDGKHSDESLHYKGLAVDISTRNKNEVFWKKIAKIIADRIGIQYDVIFEKTHIHIEFDPK